MKICRLFGVSRILVAMLLLGFLAVTAGSASAQVNLLPLQDFEGDFPPAGWAVLNDYGGPVVWHRSDQYPIGQWGDAAPPPMSSYTAYVESYPAYCGYLYDTSLVSPAFSTEDMKSVEVQFDFQYWVYSYEFLDLDYSIDYGPWVTLESLPSIGGYVAEHRTVDISVTKGNPNVRLRWRYYNLTSACDWWASIDNVSVLGLPSCIESFISQGTIYDMKDPRKDTFIIQWLTGCTGLADAVTDLSTKTVHVEVGPFSVDIPGSKFVHFRAGYYQYYKPCTLTSRAILLFRLFPTSKSLYLYGSIVSLNGIANPVTVKVSIGDMCWEATDEWREFPSWSGVKYGYRK
jgi:hypothetical protein